MTAASPAPPTGSDATLVSAHPARVPSARAVYLVRRGKPFAVVAAGRALAGRNRSRTDPTAGRFTRADVAGIFDDAFRRFDDRVPGFPAEPTAGSRQNVALAALTLSLLEALQHVGVERGYAIELTGTPAGGSTAAGGRSPTRSPT